jgi:putative ABC transport system permease protein
VTPKEAKMFGRYVVLDLLRNRWRTLSTVTGVTLGVGLFCGVLFFIDGLSASMTQRATAPLAVDMQRIVNQRTGGSLELVQRTDPAGVVEEGTSVTVELIVTNGGEFPANELTVRSLPGAGLSFVTGSAEINGVSIAGFDDNPFASGLAKTGYNLGSLEPGTSHTFSYRVVCQTTVDTRDAIKSWFSTRESVIPVSANQPPPVPPLELARQIRQIPGVAWAIPLSFADLGSRALAVGTRVAFGPARVFGFDNDYASRFETIRLVEGEFDDAGAVISVEAAVEMTATIGDRVAIALPDGSAINVPISGIADLTAARVLFSSRRGADLESFVYRPLSVIVSPRLFEEEIHTAYRRAATDRRGRLKNPPVREIDIGLDHNILDGSPALALVETQRVGQQVNAVASHQDYLLDNISNTLEVASADSDTAKRLFVFLGVPGAVLAAMLAAYAASVLAAAQRREQATLRVRGASRGHLLHMLALRTSLLTTIGSLAGLALGYAAAAMLLGQDSLARAGSASLAGSAVIGTVGGFFVTGLSLYASGHILIQRQISEERARLSERPPYWRRAGLDIVVVALVAIGTTVALRTGAFDGQPGSVYFGRAVELKLSLLLFPLTAWFAGSLLSARLFAALLGRAPKSRRPTGPLWSLFRNSVYRRPWPIGNGAVVISLIVALAVALSAFTASYDAAKASDARFANGSDLRITPGPSAEVVLETGNAAAFAVDGVQTVSPVIFGVQNVIVRSARTSDPANLMAIDPESFEKVAPLDDADFVSSDVKTVLQRLRRDSEAIFLETEMAAFLRVGVGDPIHVLLVRGTEHQIEIEYRVAGLFTRLPGAPEGAHALVALDRHLATVPTKRPDYFLASTDDGAVLESVRKSLASGPGSRSDLHIASRETMLTTDQSSLAALNIAGLVALDSAYALAMAVVAIGVFVFGLLLQRRREYAALRAQGLEPSGIRLLIVAEALTVAGAGIVAGSLVGTAMGFYFVTVLRPLFVHVPLFRVPATAIVLPGLLVLAATFGASVSGSRVVNGMSPTELLRDE